MPRAAFVAIGTYVPDRVVTNQELTKLMDTTEEWIVQRTGIQERHWVEPGLGSAEMAHRATRRALDQAGWKPEDIEAIVFASLSPDHMFPGDGCFLNAKLGIPGVPALDVRNQCSGFLYGLSVADAWIRTGTYKRILLVGSETHSTGLDVTTRGRDRHQDDRQCLEADAADLGDAEPQAEQHDAEAQHALHREGNAFLERRGQPDGVADREAEQDRDHDAADRALAEAERGGQRVGEQVARDREREGEQETGNHVHVCPPATVSAARRKGPWVPRPPRRPVVGPGDQRFQL
jgi:hypothetical protein